MIVLIGNDRYKMIIFSLYIEVSSKVFETLANITCLIKRYLKHV